MSNEEVKEEKKFNMKRQDGKQKTKIYKSFKSKVDGLEDAVFESGAMKCVAQFTKTLEEITNYVQKSITVTLQK